VRSRLLGEYNTNTERMGHSDSGAPVYDYRSDRYPSPSVDYDCRLIHKKSGVLSNAASLLQIAYRSLSSTSIAI